MPSPPPTPGAAALSLSTVQTPSGNIARFAAADSSIVSAQLATPLSGAMTLECWVKPTSANSTDMIFSLSDGDATLALSDPTDLTISLNGASVKSGVVLGTGFWRHVAIAVTAQSNGTLAAWMVIDGATALLATGALAAPDGWPESSQTATLGKNSTTGATALQGDYSEFRVWNSAQPAGLIATQ